MIANELREALFSRAGLARDRAGDAWCGRSGRHGIYDRYDYLVEKCLVVAGFSMRR
jgi:hypothetical protein